MKRSVRKINFLQVPTTCHLLTVSSSDLSQLMLIYKLCFPASVIVKSEAAAFAFLNNGMKNACGISEISVRGM